VAWLAGKLAGGDDKPDEAKLKRWLADLDHDDFRTRQAASNNLETHGEAALPLLQTALAGELSPEAKFRVERIIKALRSPAQRLGGETLRRTRAVQVLERINTRSAREQIARLAESDTASRVVLDARAAQVRMQARARGR
jgi:hypothetical protein